MSAIVPPPLPQAAEPAIQLDFMAVEATVEVVMPAMGESVTEGTVLEWHKHEGDPVSADETLVEISTDKVDAEVPAPATGTVAKLLVAEGDTVSVGDVLAEIATNGAGDGKPGASQPVPDLAAPAAAEAAAQPAAEAAEPAEAAAAAPQERETGVGSAPGPSTTSATNGAGDGSGGTTGELVDITMPAMGESVTEGTVLEWRKAEGEAIAADETVVEISTDKVDAEVPAPAQGTLAEILVRAGDSVSVGQLLGRISTSPADGRAAQPRTAAPSGASNGGQASTAGPGRAAPQAPDGAPIADGGQASPVARRAAQAHGVQLSSVSGTGPAGRITKADVLAAADGEATNAAPPRAPAPPAPPAAPGAPPSGQVVTPLRGSAAMLARYMDESRSIPTATSFRTMTVTVLEGRRRELKAAEQRVSFTHLIAYAIARAATDLPVMTHHFAEVDGNPNRIEDGAVNLGIAVDVERKDGTRTLMVPVIRDAGRLAFRDFVAAYDALIAKARDNALTADDLVGANITLTNPGGLGTVASVPRLMVGQGTIVATGSIAYPVGLGAIGNMIVA